MVSISAFRGLFQKGWVPASRYQVMYYGSLLHPEQITLPSRSIQTYTDSLYGPIRAWPMRELYNDNIVLTFAEAIGNEMRSMWENDSLLMSDGGVASAGQFIDTRSSNLQIHVLDQNDNTFAIYRVYGAYPISIIPTNMGWAMMNETQKVQVMIKYYKYDYEVI